MMKNIKWKTLIITCLMCLLPITYGFILWDRLPDTIAIHFNLNNQPDNFASKGFAVFCLPLLMFFAQALSCIVIDINSYKRGELKKLEMVTKWIVPVMANILQIITLGYSLGWFSDIRRCVVPIIGVIFLVTGNYMPKLDYVKNYNIDTEKARKINRFLGFETVVMGILFLVTMFLPPVSTVICLILLIPYTIIGVIYSVIIVRKN